MIKREWGAESNGKLPQLFAPSKTETLVPALAVKHRPWVEHSWEQKHRFQWDKASIISKDKETQGIRVHPLYRPCN